MFDSNDLLALRLFRDLLDDGLEPARAGHVACEVANAARRWPEAAAISFVENFFHDGGSAHPAEQIPPQSEWATTLWLGTDIRKVTTFRIDKLRELIALAIAKEGQADE